MKPVKLRGIGQAVVVGYRKAIEEGVDIIVKIDGDGQMAPEIIGKFIGPIARREADYTKGNRFFHLDDCRKMPLVRTFGNAVLSFFNKFSSGYWDVFDPTNGYTAISVNCLRFLPLHKISTRYFFESDMLFRLSLVGATVKDIPMVAIYEDEVSNLKISRILVPFLEGHGRNFIKRLIYNYFIRDFSVASVELILGGFLFSFGVIFGSFKWIESIVNNSIATSGTVMLASLPVILGVQLLLSFIGHDIQMNLRRNKAVYTEDDASL